MSESIFADGEITRPLGALGHCADSPGETVSGSSKTTDPRVVSDLIDRLNDRDADIDIRGRAVCLLGEIQDKRVNGDTMHQCLTIAATAYRAVRISLPSICWNGARTCSSGTSRLYVKRCGALGPSAHFTSTAGWFCRNHLHCVLTLPPGDDDFSNRIKAIKIRFVRAVEPNERRSSVRIARGERGIWQRRFWEHAIRDEGDYARHRDYVHYNPVKQGHVTAVAQWPYSTFHRWVKAGVYPVGWGGDGVTDVPAGEHT